MHHPVLHHCGAQHDAGIEAAIGREIAHAARIGAARFGFQLGNDLAGADLGCARDRARRKARKQRVERIFRRIEPPHHIADDVHHVAVAFDGEAVGDLHRPRRRHPAHIIAPEIEQHQVLGALLGIGEQAAFIGVILLAGLAARTRPGDGADRDLTLSHPHEDLRRGTDQREPRQIEEIEERRGVHPPQRAIQRQRGQGEGAGEALGEHHLEDVARKDVVLRAQGHRLVIVGRDHRGEIGEGIGHRFARGDRQGGAELAQGRIDPLPRTCHGSGGVARLPDRGDGEQRIGQPVEHQNDRGAHEQHVGQVERAVGRAGQGLDQADGLIAEIADETGEGGGQALGHGIDAAGRGECAQFGQRIAFERGEGLGIELPVAVDLGCIAARAEHQIGIEPEQAVAPAHLAALDRFEQEVAAPRHDQPPRRAHRRIAVGDDPPPHQRSTPFGERGYGTFGIVGQASGRSGHEAITPAPIARQRAACARRQSPPHCG